MCAYCTNVHALKDKRPYLVALYVKKERQRYVTMSFASTSTSQGDNIKNNSISIGIFSLNKTICTRLEQLVINIGCQSREKLKNSLQLIGNQIVARKVVDNTITPKYMVILLISSLIGLAWDLWKWLPESTKDEILNSPMEDDTLLYALGER